jgi:arsenate reductase (glutaredoxin)
MNTLYGIPNDFKKHGVPADRLDAWLLALGWERLLNRQGTTWRKLDEATRTRVSDTTSARTLMLQHPSVIKRPVMEWGPEISVGFQAADWQKRLPPPAVTP